MIRFFSRFFARIIVNGGVIFLVLPYIGGVTITEGLKPLLLVGVMLAGLNTFVKPIIRIITAPLVWITFGLFSIVIHIIILSIADYLLPQLTFHNFYSLIVTSLIIAVVNVFI